MRLLRLSRVRGARQCRSWHLEARVEAHRSEKPLPVCTGVRGGSRLRGRIATHAYLERRVGDRELAEDVLQDAFVKLMDRPDQAPTDEGIVPWFYRTLRNAAVDRFRRRDAAGRALMAISRELQAQETPDAEIEAEICACIGRLTTTLEPEYSDALPAVDVQAVPVKAFATARGLSASNAGVRVFRAREALKKRVT
jgi:RNA polymerase sigma factor (sigma-70 family)